MSYFARLAELRFLGKEPEKLKYADLGFKLIFHKERKSP